MPKDACYHKVKARYRVFPSAYASGAIAKCSVGAANYGTGGKKKKKKAKEDGELAVQWPLKCSHGSVRSITNQKTA